MLAIASDHRLVVVIALVIIVAKAIAVTPERIAIITEVVFWWNLDVWISIWAAHKTR
ncbi:MAG: hypothetical protein ACFB4J_05945 [Elainellaceae cyanobacterium]